MKIELTESGLRDLRSVLRADAPLPVGLIRAALELEESTAFGVARTWAAGSGQRRTYTAAVTLIREVRVAAIARPELPAVDVVVAAGSFRFSAREARGVLSARVDDVHLVRRLMKATATLSWWGKLPFVDAVRPDLLDELKASASERRLWEILQWLASGSRAEVTGRALEQMVMLFEQLPAGPERDRLARETARACQRAGRWSDLGRVEQVVCSSTDLEFLRELAKQPPNTRAVLEHVLQHAQLDDPPLRRRETDVVRRLRDWRAPRSSWGQGAAQAATPPERTPVTGAVRAALESLPEDADWSTFIVVLSGMGADVPLADAVTAAGDALR